jgi:hypothetical protein
MLRRKMGETYEASAYAVLHSPPEQPKQELIRLFNCAVKTYKDMLVRAYVRFYPSRLKQIQRLTSCRSCRLAQASRIKLIIVFDRLTPWSYNPFIVGAALPIGVEKNRWARVADVVGSRHGPENLGRFRRRHCLHKRHQSS